MAYGWAAWKNRAVGNACTGRSKQAKERAYLRGFKAAAKEGGLPADVGDTASCPGDVLDDPGIDAGGAYDLGRWDAKAVAARRGAA